MPDRDLNPDLPVIVSIVYYKSDALDHVATKEEMNIMKASVLLFVVACVFLLEGTQGADYPDPETLTNKANEENLTNILKCFYSEGECPKGADELKGRFRNGIYSKMFSIGKVVDTNPRTLKEKGQSSLLFFFGPPSKKIWAEEDESEDKSREPKPTPSTSESYPAGSASKAQVEAPRSTSTVEQCPNAIVFDTSLINERDPCHDPVLAKKYIYDGAIKGRNIEERAAACVEKDIFPTVAVSACSNCNPTQKKWFRIVGRYLLANRPADIKKLRETFDPSEEHKEEFLKFITSDD
uniref:Chemosensory protein n=1 Tax=Timema bartmani TaxID=61472 RepID=A0A7R9FB85_9NEOP|nr:unnamed protein product [Timema bartmani]